MSDTESTLHEVILALQETSLIEMAECALCKLVARSVSRSIHTLAAEFVNDTQTRIKLRESRGFCSGHSRLILDHLDPVAVSILYLDLTEVTHDLWSGIRKPVNTPRLFGKAAKAASCPPCVTANEASLRFCGALAAALSQADVWNAVESNRWICVSHSELIQKLARPPESQRLRLLEMKNLKNLQAELEEIIRKNDYRFRGEVWGKEKDAWIRAINKLKRPSE